MIKAELLAARGTRSMWVLGAVTVAFGVAWAVLEVLVFMRRYGDTMDTAYGMAAAGFLFAMVLGIMLTAGEYRHRTITWTLLVNPRRARMIAAKLAACALLGLLVGLAAALVTTPVVAGLAAATGRPAADAGVPAVVAGSVASIALWTTLGGALGVLVRNQAAAITIAFVWFYNAESGLIALAPAVGRWTPSGAARALTGLNRTGSPVPGALLPTWAGGLLLLGYALAAALAAHVVTARRDIS